jgi:hypothetical protein
MLPMDMPQATGTINAGSSAGHSASGSQGFAMSCHVTPHVSDGVLVIDGRDTMVPSRGW